MTCERSYNTSNRDHAAIAHWCRKLVIMAGQPIDMGDEACMLFTFADLDAREKAETALRESEERFTKAFQLSL